ncbi:MAG: hypothetical protein JWL59_4799 [Chthoniobacteraceae bacterium]|nr:hypothetical protein [Chthoniobacteraceae bacterium]
MGRRSGHAGFELRTAVDIQRIGRPRRLPKDGFAAGQLIEMECSLDLFKQLQAILTPVQQLTDVIEGSEAYMAALSYYNTVKLAAKNGAPGAQAVYEKLKGRFVQSGALVPVAPASAETDAASE